MPKFFGAWIDKFLPACLFYQIPEAELTIREVQACPWYLEMAHKFAPGQEMDEQVAIAIRTRIPEDFSANELEPEVPMEEVHTDPPKEKK